MDVYFSNEYGRLYEGHENAKFCIFEFTSENGCVRYGFLKRETPFCVDGKTYFDIFTPYGYGGPVIYGVGEKRKAALLCEFQDKFCEYCSENNIVTEFIRFHPILKNYEDFAGAYRPAFLRETIAIDLDVDFFNQEFTSKCRNQIKKAEREGLRIECDFEGHSMQTFRDIYDQTMTYVNAASFYYFKGDFYEKLIRDFKNKFMIVNAKLDEETISSSLFLIGENIIHYHLSGTLSEYKGLCANQLIIYEAAKWAQAARKKWMHLGGGVTNKEDDSLLGFKKNFSRNNRFKFFIGKMIRNSETFEKLKRIAMLDPEWDDNYFPPYAKIKKW